MLICLRTRMPLLSIMTWVSFCLFCPSFFLSFGAYIRSIFIMFLERFVSIFNLICRIFYMLCRTAKSAYKHGITCIRVYHCNRDRWSPSFLFNAYIQSCIFEICIFKNAHTFLLHSYIISVTLRYSYHIIFILSYNHYLALS